MDLTLKELPFSGEFLKRSTLVTGRNVAVFLLLLDILGLFISVCLTVFWRLGVLLPIFDPLFFGFMAAVLLGLYLGDAYRPDTQLTGLRAPARVLVMSLVVGVASSTLLYLFALWGHSTMAGRGIWLPSLIFFTVWAVLIRLWVAPWMKIHVQQRRWLVLVGDENTQQFGVELKKLDPLGRFVMLSQDRRSWSIRLEDRVDGDGIFHAASLEELSDWLLQPWTGVIVGNAAQLSEQQIKRLVDIRLQGGQIFSPQEFYESFAYKIPAALLHDSWFALASGFSLFQSRLSWKLRRLIDIVVASLVLIVLSPLMSVVALAVKLESPGSIFYKQMRTGLHGKPFGVIKFRSMLQNAERQGAQWASLKDPRITRVGYLLRLMRIDELPQLWNVLRGEMSLIGPRPERPEFDQKLAAEIPYYNIRYLVKPGITGWAQVMYPYGASVEDSYEKLSYDLYYIKNFSFWLDIAIALKTLRVVFLGKGR
jgi:exopolysaccharide biosynthesis polyprenyl glycosylphosphotransferase